MIVRPLIRGLLTFVPVAGSLTSRRRAGHTDSAEYCYSVWLKHMTLLRAHGLQSMPGTVAELGPGKSIGAGLAALLSGAEHYVGLDVAGQWDIELNLRILDELIDLFRAHAPRPDRGWPDFSPYLDARLFPSLILTPEVLERTLAPDRIDRIRKALEGKQAQGASPTIKYMVPWSDPAIIEENSVDLVFSHSVLEHVVDLEGTYQALYAWLKPGAWTSHQVDFTSHGLTKEWNGYRACSEALWKMILGRRLYLINRHPVSVHLDLIEKAGLRITVALENRRTDGVQRARLASRWAAISEDDLTCCGLYLIARK